MGLSFVSWDLIWSLINLIKSFYLMRELPIWFLSMPILPKASLTVIDDSYLLHWEFRAWISSIAFSTTESSIGFESLDDSVLSACRILISAAVKSSWLVPSISSLSFYANIHIWLLVKPFITLILSMDR